MESAVVDTFTTSTSDHDKRPTPEKGAGRAAIQHYCMYIYTYMW